MYSLASAIEEYTYGRDVTPEFLVSSGLASNIREAKNSIRISKDSPLASRVYLILCRYLKPLDQLMLYRRGIKFIVTGLSREEKAKTIAADYNRNQKVIKRDETDRDID